MKSLFKNLFPRNFLLPFCLYLLVCVSFVRVGTLTGDKHLPWVLVITVLNACTAWVLVRHAATEAETRAYIKGVKEAQRW